MMHFPWNLFLGFILFSGTLLAQPQHKELKVKYGKISEEEIALTAYKDDPGAPGMVLFDKGLISNRYVDNQGFVLEFERHVRIKIFHKDAYSLPKPTTPPPISRRLC